MIAPIEALNAANAAATRRPPTTANTRERQRQSLAASGSTSESFISRSLGRHPTTAIVSSVMVGLALGWLIKRKWNR